MNTQYREVHKALDRANAAVAAIGTQGRDIDPRDQEFITGERTTEEPLKTLKDFRFDRGLRGVTFGQNMVLVSGLGNELKVGQRLDVTWARDRARATDYRA